MALSSLRRQDVSGGVCDSGRIISLHREMKLRGGYENFVEVSSIKYSSFGMVNITVHLDYIMTAMHSTLREAWINAGYVFLSIIILK